MPFPLDLLRGDDFITLYGVRREGKSWMMRYFCYLLRGYFRCGEVFSKTAMNGYWQQYVIFIFNVFKLRPITLLNKKKTLSF